MESTVQCLPRKMGTDVRKPRWSIQEMLHPFWRVQGFIAEAERAVRSFCWSIPKKY